MAMRDMTPGQRIGDGRDRVSHHRRSRGSVLVLALLALPVASACGLLFPQGYGSQAGSDPLATPTTLATYATGSATVTVTRGARVEKIELQRVGPGSTLTSELGAFVTWRNDDGWILRVTAFGAGGTAPVPMAASTQVTLERITTGALWTTETFFEDRCIATTTEASAQRLAGDATCKGLRWIDGIAGQGGLGPAMGEPPYIVGEEPFDAEITFQATP